IADDLGRDALVDRAHRTRIHQQRVVGVAVDVDEPRCNRKAGGVDLESIRVDLPYAGDAPRVDRDVGDATLGAGAVVHRPVSDDELHARLPPNAEPSSRRSAKSESENVLSTRSARTAPR